MKHTQEQLNTLWNNLRNGVLEKMAAPLRAVTPPGSVDVLPIVVISDSAAQVMSVPINDNTDRVVYARQAEGGRWVELPTLGDRKAQADEPVLVAHVTVDDETLTVGAARVSEALAALHGTPAPGMRVNARVVFDAITRAEFDALPEFKT